MSDCTVYGYDSSCQGTFMEKHHIAIVNSGLNDLYMLSIFSLYLKVNAVIKEKNEARQKIETELHITRTREINFTPSPGSTD